MVARTYEANVFEEKVFDAKILERRQVFKLSLSFAAATLAAIGLLANCSNAESWKDGNPN